MGLKADSQRRVFPQPRWIKGIMMRTGNGLNLTGFIGIIMRALMDISSNFRHQHFGDNPYY
jgi:hypothetical protein